MDTPPTAIMTSTTRTGERRASRTLTIERFRLLEAALHFEGYAQMIEWSETLKPVTNCRAFATEAIYVICNSGMRVTVANMIYWRCMRALRRGIAAATVFGHPGKAAAIDHIWAHRKVLFDAYRVAENKIAFCGILPWIGPVTKHHLAKNLGVNTVKPDVHLARLAKAERTTPWLLCERLASQTGYKESTIDMMLWRACADGLLSSSTYVVDGWDAALRPGLPKHIALRQIAKREAVERSRIALESAKAVA